MRNNVDDVSTDLKVGLEDLLDVWEVMLDPSHPELAWDTDLGCVPVVTTKKQADSGHLGSGFKGEEQAFRVRGLGFREKRQVETRNEGGGKREGREGGGGVRA